MQRRILSGLAALAAALPLASHAETMSYTYAELGYVDANLDVGSFNVDGDGFALRGSLAVLQNYFVFANYQDLSFDGGVDTTLLEVGGGGHWPLSDKVDIIGKVGITKAELDSGRFDADDDGFLLGARVRGVIAPKVELEAGFDYRDLDEAGDDTTLVFDGRYFFIENLAGGVTAAFGDDDKFFGLNLRYAF
jgi:outer membrane protein with beta-barrel domain